jgi:hypothetical protein
MLGSSRVAAQLAASREGLGFMSDDDILRHLMTLGLDFMPSGLIVGGFAPT